MRAVTAEMMKAIDRRAQEHFGIPGLILTEHAGKAAAGEAIKLLARRRNRSVCMFCGPGNNAGDGFVAARHLAQTGVRVNMFLLAAPEKLRGATRVNFDMCHRLKIPWHCCRTEKDLRWAERNLLAAGLIIDALFRIGLNKPVAGIYQQVIVMLNKSRVPILALDIPSGLCATSGRIWGYCVRARNTVTFGLPKRGFYLRQGPAHAGKIVVVDIGLPRSLLDKTGCRFKKACK